MGQVGKPFIGALQVGKRNELKVTTASSMSPNTTKKGVRMAVLKWVSRG